MKKIILLLTVFVLGTAVSYGQKSYRLKRSQYYRTAGALKDADREIYAIKNSTIDINDAFGSIYNGKESADYEDAIGQYNDSLYVIVSWNNKVYLGGIISEKYRDRTVRNGNGIQRMEYKAEDDTTQYEYYIGEWDNNYRHGKGYYVMADGKMFAGTWALGKLKKKTRRDILTEEEIAHVKKSIDVINGITIKKE